MISAHLHHSTHTSHTGQCVGTKVHPILTVSSLANEASQEMSFFMFSEDGNLEAPWVSLSAAIDAIKTPKVRPCCTTGLVLLVSWLNRWWRLAGKARICLSLHRGQRCLSVLRRLGLLPKDPCQALAVRVLRRKRLEILGMILASKGHTDILTYYTTLRIQYNSIIFNVHTSFASCISCTSGAAMQASLLVAASALDTEAEKLKSGDWKGY